MGGGGGVGAPSFENVRCCGIAVKETRLHDVASRRVVLDGTATILGICSSSVLFSLAPPSEAAFSVLLFALFPGMIGSFGELSRHD